MPDKADVRGKASCAPPGFVRAEDCFVKPKKSIKENRGGLDYEEN